MGEISEALRRAREGREPDSSGPRSRRGTPAPPSRDVLEPTRRPAPTADPVSTADPSPAAEPARAPGPAPVAAPRGAEPVLTRFVTEIPSSDIDVSVPALSWNDETKTAALDLETPGDEIHFLGESNPIRARARKLPFGDHLFDDALRLHPNLALHAELFEQVFLGSRATELPKAFSDLLANRVWAECHKGIELKAGPSLCIIDCSIASSAEVAERQTRCVQGAVSFGEWGFKSPLRHQP